MKRLKRNITLQVLKTADTKLRKAIISKCNKKLVHFISECTLNVLHNNTKMTVCDTRKLQKQKVALRKVSDKRVPLSAKKKFIVQRGGFLLPLFSDILPTLASIIVRNR